MCSQSSDHSRCLPVPLLPNIPSAWPAIFWTLTRRLVSAKTIKQHFTPPYGPWEQRVCKSPGGDFFVAMNDGAQVATGTINSVEADGIALNDGRFLPADIIITAAGLELEVFGKAAISVDSKQYRAPDMVAYRGLMMDGLPNFSTTIGYLNLSWTLRAGLTSRYMVNLWKMMEGKGSRTATPRKPAEVPAGEPLLGWDSGYIKRAEHRPPTQSAQDPWLYEQDYIVERKHLLGKDMTKDIEFA